MTLKITKLCFKFSINLIVLHLELIRNWIKYQDKRTRYPPQNEGFRKRWYG